VHRPLIMLFLLTRLLYSYAGVTWAESPLTGFWQVADTELLKTRLWETVTHLHSQAPLFNLFIGLGLKFFGENSSLYFHISFSVMAYVFLATIAVTLRALNIARPIRSVSGAPGVHESRRAHA
jgi:hypothetical protein